MSSPDIFRLNQKIDPYALYKLSNQLNELAHPLSQRTSTYRTFNGLPCAHDVLRIRINNTYIPLNVVLCHWHFDRALTVANIYPPLLYRYQIDSQFILEVDQNDR